MPTNLSIYDDRLKKLEDDGLLLFTAMQIDEYGEEGRSGIRQQLGDKADAYIARLPKFRSGYQPWYSEAKAAIRQLIPDRLADFTRTTNGPQIERRFSGITIP